MKKQRIIHLTAAVTHFIWPLVAWHFLPPWLAHNPGVIIGVGALCVESLAHFIWHGK